MNSNIVSHIILRPGTYFEEDLDPAASRTLCTLYQSEYMDTASFYTAEENYDTANVVVDYALLLPLVLCIFSLTLLYIGYHKPHEDRKKNYGLYTYQSISNQDCDP
jgi:hypothetical protein